MGYFWVFQIVRLNDISLSFIRAIVNCGDWVGIAVWRFVL